MTRLSTLLLRLPIVRLLQSHRDHQSETDGEQAELRRRTDDNARRVEEMERRSPDRRRDLLARQEWEDRMREEIDAQLRASRHNLDSRRKGTS